jgi:NADPH2 dehydrogenase
MYRYPNVPGIYSPAQIRQWREITDAVHKRGSFIYMQLWALGRAAMPDKVKAEGGDYVSSSATPMTPDGAVPRELTESEIKDFVGDYAQAAKNAIEAGFDGVEIHGANGYLVDQFTQDTCNKRTDKYGGSIENRSRFGLEVAKAVVDAIGADRTGIRLSPYSKFQAMGMEDPIPQFTHLIKGLKELKLAFLHLVESRINGSTDKSPEDKVELLNWAIDEWGNTSPILLAGGYNAELAKSTVESVYADKDLAIVFGRYFISNPDLAFRVLNNVALEPYDRSTFYKAKSEEGYITYPNSKEFENSSKL